MANIFDYATSELSQDAFLCWMFASLGGDLCEKTKSKQTYEIVRKIIFDLIDIEDTNQEVKVLWIQKQWHGIDVVIELMIADVMYVVAFEDKYYSSVHNVSNTDENQLIIYRKRLLEYWDNEKHKRDIVPLPNHIKTIYYKRTFFNNWESYLKDALPEWKFFDILDIIKLFKAAFVGYKDLESEILSGYIAKLKYLDCNFKGNSNVLNWMIWKDKDHDLMWEYLFKKLKEKIECSNSKLRLNCQYFNGKYLIASFKYVDDKSTKYFPFIEIHPREFEKHQKYRFIFKVKVYDIEISARTKEFFLEIQRRIEEFSKMNNFEYKLSNVLINELDNGLAKDDKHSNHAGSFKKEINADYISIDETISMIESIVIDFYKMLNK